MGQGYFNPLILNSLIVFIHPQADEVLDTVLAGLGPLSGPGSAGRRTRAEKALSECEDPPPVAVSEVMGRLGVVNSESPRRFPGAEG